MKAVLCMLAGVCTLLATEYSQAAKAWWSHVAYLADDKLEGRKAGTEGYRRAVEYVRQQFASADVKPGVSGKYTQTVRFRMRQLDERQSSLALIREGNTRELQLGEEANLLPRGNSGSIVEADAVFVGDGLRIPEAGIDDLKGLDLKGKIAVLVASAPKSVPGPVASHAQSAAERWKVFRDAGAIGIASIANPKTSDIPWARATLARLQPSLTLADPTLNDAAGMQVALVVNAAHADLFFEGTGHTIDELLALDNAGQGLPRFPLKGRIRAKAQFSTTEVESDNVVGITEGSDPKLKNECIVLSAHLDHLGVGKPINGDSIYNGAMDNASGIASLIETAKLLAKSRLSRCVVYLAVTGEESGLLGSKYFAANPTVPGQIVAAINMDMYLPLFPLKAVAVQGLEESELGPEFAAVARRFGVEAKADPEPERKLFIRSDQYSFIRRGIPALAFKFYAAPGSQEYAIVANWRKNRYHAPSDDLEQPVDTEGAAKFTRILAAMVEDVANRPASPHWTDSSFFRRFELH